MNGTLFAFLSPNGKIKSSEIDMKSKTIPGEADKIIKNKKIIVAITKVISK